MGIRRQSRECALQMLYQMDIGGSEPAAVKRHFWERPEADCSSKGFACELFDGVLSKLAEIDEIISKNSENWKLSRMASVDKNILRVAVFELLWKQDIPVKVSINEAVEIAKRFGTTDSGSFVNGILDNIAKGITKDVESSEDES